MESTFTNNPRSTKQFYQSSINIGTTRKPKSCKQWTALIRFIIWMLNFCRNKIFGQWLWQVGREVASKTRDPPFQSSHRQILFPISCITNCIERTNIEEKESGNHPNKNTFNEWYLGKQIGLFLNSSKILRKWQQTTKDVVKWKSTSFLESRERERESKLIL